MNVPVDDFFEIWMKYRNSLTSKTSRKLNVIAILTSLSLVSQGKVCQYLEMILTECVKCI